MVPLAIAATAARLLRRGSIIRGGSLLDLMAASTSRMLTTPASAAWGWTESSLELFLNKKSDRLTSKKPWREPTDGDAHPRRPSDESPDRLVPNPIQLSAARVQRHLPGGAAENL